MTETGPRVRRRPPRDVDRHRLSTPSEQGRHVDPGPRHAIADIFEALTAADRPYKKAKTLSESVRIMSLMKKDQHIDPDLFALFLNNGVFTEYAEKFLLPEQIDDVDIGQFLNSDG